MKKSEELRQQSAREDNDLKALGLQTKAIREQRSENFEERWLPKLQEKIDVLHIPDKGCYRIDLHDIYGHGVIDYYPKANRVHLHRTNQWHKPGLPWLIKNILSKTL